MAASLLELAPVALELLVYALGSVLFSAAGVYIENTALSTVTGQPLVGAWLAFVGVVALAVSYTLLTDKFVPTLCSFRADGGAA
jgi:hypothetical protein